MTELIDLLEESAAFLEVYGEKMNPKLFLRILNWMNTEVRFIN